jgi:2-polyprenyl-3-methyl-5-hydroxy-6-metoxy-1,4-benzoquinol methylase
MQLRILVTIANFGVKNDQYLFRLLDEYRTFPAHVDVIVLSNVEKDCGKDVQVIVRKPAGNPWTFPFAHQQLLAEQVNSYDLFIYSEDDTLITFSNIAAFLRASQALLPDEIPGFMRVEKLPDGGRSISTINSHFHWDVDSVIRRGGDVFAFFTNHHSASYILTQDQLRRAIASGGYLVQPHQEQYDFLVTAATDPYTQCGFRKLICISDIENFLLPHLPNKYLGQFGIGDSDFRAQLDALLEIASGVRPAVALMDTDSGAYQSRWSRHFYQLDDPELMAMVPRNTKTLLSFGCGIGEAERRLVESGVQVTAIPLNSVVAACAERRGIPTIHTRLAGINEALTGRLFDTILISDLLHLHPEPAELLRMLKQFLKPEGALICSVPNTVDQPLLWGGRTVSRGPKLAGSSAAALRQWFSSAGLTSEAAHSSVGERARWQRRMGGRILPELFAKRFIVRGRTFIHQTSLEIPA